MSTLTYLISWHYHITGGSNIAVTSPTFFLRSSENGGRASCPATTADVTQRENEGEQTTAGKTLTCQFLSWAGLTQEQGKDTTQKDTEKEQF